MARRPAAARSVHQTAGKVPLWTVGGLAVLLLVAARIAYDSLAERLHVFSEKPINLPVPLSSLPAQVGPWFGKDLSIPTTTKEYMEKNFADDFLSRRYINGATNAWVDLYVVYCASRPAGMLGHKPGVCYPGHGWIADGMELSDFKSQSGRRIPCLIHRFSRPAPRHEQIVVLNFYLLNGQIATDEKAFSSPFGRRPNIGGDLARYVAQVQISSVLENSTRRAAEAMTDLLLEFLPDENGTVAATERAYAGSGTLK
ncbi:MAG: exosortase-associated EpsI family protein [Phycisphaerales bacterium]|nr:MAG: exosortase-associated EpsI family protein [Phycisphaerales bacterium]